MITPKDKEAFTLAYLKDEILYDRTEWVKSGSG